MATRCSLFRRGLQDLLEHYLHESIDWNSGLGCFGTQNGTMPTALENSASSTFVLLFIDQTVLLRFL